MLRLAILCAATSFISTSAFSQIATNSLFRETKSINPAVISKRPDAVFSLTGKMDKVDKTQDLSTSIFGTEAKSDTAVKVYSGDLFYGGKGDGGFTTELFVNTSQGKKNNKLSASNFSNSSTDDVKANYGHLGLGLGRNFGLSLGFIKYDYNSIFKYTFMSETYSNEMEAQTNVMIPKIGVAYNMGLDWGLYFERMLSTQKLKQDGNSSTKKENFNLAGAGVGTSSKYFHTEIAYEKQLTGQTVTNDGFHFKKIYPTRAMFSLEFFLGKMSFGYTGFYYQNGFMNLDNLLFNSLVYTNTWEKPRLENNFNFSLGSDKGHSFSGSLSFSTVKNREKSLYTAGDDKYNTTTKAMGVSAKYAYIF